MNECIFFYLRINTQHIRLTLYLAHEIVLWQIQNLLCYCTGITLFYFVFPSTSPPRGDLTEGFFALQVLGAYIWRGLFSEVYGISEEERCVTTLSANQGPVPERLISNITPEVKF